jgi:phosphatidate cytidylyltransferase
MISVFFSRLSSTLVLWAAVLWAIFSGSELGFSAFIAIMGLTGLWEFYRMLDHKELPNFRITGMIFGVLLLAGTSWALSARGIAEANELESFLLAVSLLTLFSQQMIKGLRGAESLSAIAYTLFGLLYVVVLFNFMNKLVYVAPRTAEGIVTGQFYVLYLMVVTKFSDMGAYVTGSLIGKHPAVPSISPKKTWEGFSGAMVFSLLGSFGMMGLLGSKLPLITPLHATVLGLLLGFSAIIGDLAESVIKRATDIKDSGRFLPGIGGALDLIDSLLFTAPILFFYLRCLLN